MSKSMPLWAAVVVVCGVGCVGGQSGDSGKLRFGQVYLFAEATDFSTAIAVGQPMPLGLQAPAKEALLGDYEYLDGTLDVLDASGAKLEVTRMSKGKFQTEFPTAGSYTLVGKNAGTSDRLTVTAADQAGLRLAKQWYLHGTGTDAACKPAQPVAGQLPALKSNQTLTVSVVPQTKDGAPLVGLVDLTAEAKGAVISRNEGISRASYTVSPSGASTHGEITFTDQKTKQSFKVELDLLPNQTEPCRD